MIKAVIFDFGGVMINDTDPVLYKFIADACRISLDKATEELDRLDPEFQTGKIDEKTFWQRFQQSTGAFLPEDYMEILYREYKKERRLNIDIVDIVKNLKAAGYILPLLSNTIEPHSRCNKESGYYDLFFPVILSDEVGLRKPDPQIYLLVLKKIGLKPEECIFIDDRKKYTDAAEKVGINGIQFRDAEQLKKELAGLSIRLGSSQNL